MIFLALPVLAILCLALSLLASLRTPRHETQADAMTRHLGSVESALWAIALLLLWIGVR